MSDIWKSYASDFDNMSDDEIKRYTRDMERELEDAEAWLEAVASWEKAGRPRSLDAIVPLVANRKL